MSIREEQWRAILQAVLARYDRTDARTLALGAVVSWEQLVSSLTPLLGPDSVYLIYQRCLDLNKSMYPWLPKEPCQGQIAYCLEALRRSLALQPMDELMRANFSLLYTFVDVLAALIGERLATNILLSAFPAHGPAGQDQENG